MICCFILLSGFTPSKYTYGEDNLFTTSVRSRFEEINSKYDVGEPFSEEDAAFIRENSFFDKAENSFIPNLNILTDNSSISPMDLTIWADGYWTERGSGKVGCNISYTSGADYRIKTSLIGTGAATYTSGVRLVIHSNAHLVKEVLLGTKLTTYGLLGNSGTIIGITSSTTKTKVFSGGNTNYYASLSNTNYVLLTAWGYGNSWVEVDTSNCSTNNYVF